MALFWASGIALDATYWILRGFKPHFDTDHILGLYDRSFSKRSAILPNRHGFNWHWVWAFSIHSFSPRTLANHEQMMAAARTSTAAIKALRNASKNKLSMRSRARPQRPFKLTESKKKPQHQQETSPPHSLISRYLTNKRDAYRAIRVTTRDVTLLRRYS